ncbi:MAG: D-glycerate dehydrogenase [Asgard group archaeon]|nr:D-glycerate dehydrogenase [Asgard group archaeon]
MTFDVLLTRKIPQPAIDKIEQNNVNLEINPHDRVMTKKEIIKKVKGKDGLLCLLTDQIDEEVITAGGKKLKIIANYAVGYNNIDIKAAAKKGIPVTNTPGVLTEATADLTMALLLSIARRIVESDKFTRAGKFNGWGPMLHIGGDVTGKTIGIIGLGRIGSAVAKRAAKGFDMKVLYYNRSKKPKIEKELGAEKVELKTLLKKADYVTLHVPLTGETHHLIGKKELEMMKETAYLINTSRGPVVDEQALVEILQTKQITGAALDVYENEPKVTDGLKTLDNVILTAHIGSATRDTRTKMGLIAAENLLAGLEGKTPPNIVNKEFLK